MNTLFIEPGCPVQSLSLPALFAEHLHVFSQLQPLVLTPTTINGQRGQNDYDDIEDGFKILDAIMTEVKKRMREERMGLTGGE
jgi:hypothetical protein